MGDGKKGLSFPTGGLPAGSILGVPLRIHPLSAVAAALLSYTFAGQLHTWTPDGTPPAIHLAMGVAGYLAMAASLVAHEFAHILTARSYGTGCC